MKTRIALLCFVLAAGALPSFAQFQPRMPVQETEPEVQGEWSGSVAYSSGEYLDNPCTATVDWVWVTYTADVYLNGWQTSTGDEPVLFDESTTVGGGYAVSGTSQSEVDAQQPYSLRKYHKVNTADDFHVVTVITFYPASRETVVTRETACGNGLPDSAQ